MPLYNLNDEMRLRLQGNYDSYLNGTYEKRPILKFYQFCKLYDMEFVGLNGNAKEKLTLINNLSELLSDFFAIFWYEKDECLEYANNISDIIKMLASVEINKEEVPDWSVERLEHWAVCQYEKILENYCLKIKVAYEQLKSNELFDACVEDNEFSKDSMSELKYMFCVLFSYAAIMRADEKAEEEREFERVFGKN